MSSNNIMTDTIQKNKEKFMNLIEKFGGIDNLTDSQVNELCNIPIVLLSPETLEDWLGLYEIPEEKDSYYTHKFPLNRSEFLEDGGKAFASFLKRHKGISPRFPENILCDDHIQGVFFNFNDKKYAIELNYCED